MENGRGDWPEVQSLLASIKDLGGTKDWGAASYPWLWDFLQQCLSILSCLSRTVCANSARGVFGGLSAILGMQFQRSQSRGRRTVKLSSKVARIAWPIRWKMLLSVTYNITLSFFLHHWQVAELQYSTISWGISEIQTCIHNTSSSRTGTYRLRSLSSVLR